MLTAFLLINILDRKHEIGGSVTSFGQFGRHDQRSNENETVCRWL